MKVHRLLSITLFAAALLAGCGGGSSSSVTPGGSITLATPTAASSSQQSPTAAPTVTPSTSPSPIVTATSFPTSTPTATATPIATSSALSTAVGTVNDLGAQRYYSDGNTAGSAIAGATVVVGPVLINGATAPPSLPTGDGRATTSAIGAFSVSYQPGGTTYVMVFPPQPGDPHISLHGLANLTSGTIRPLYLYAPSSGDLTELAQINADRTSNGAGTVIFDEYAVETARAHSDFMATTGYIQHCIMPPVPISNCYVNPAVTTSSPTSYPAQYVSPDNLYDYLGGAIVLATDTNQTENYYYGWPSSNATYASWASADASFMAEKTASPQGLHYLNIVNTTHLWVGVGSNSNGIPIASSSGQNVGIYIQEFYSPTGGV